MNIGVSLRSLMLGTTVLCGVAMAGQAVAQTAEETAVEEVVVVGTQIEGSKVTAALPVTVVGQEQIENIAATSGDDLFRSIPQMGDVSFNSAYLPNSSNSARGDVGSVNLRNLGVGNTLVLLNGRRVVAHPTSRADENLVPVLTYNTNAIPVSGLKRLEVLRDGAAALYGSDAVAGVVNTVLQDNYDGMQLEAQYGVAEGTHLTELELNGLFGKNFERGNVSLFLNYTNKSALRAWDQDYTSSSDKRPLFVGTRFEGAAGLDGRATTMPWASLQTVGNVPVRIGTRNVTSSAGAFHPQPSTSAGCTATIGAGVCLDDAAPATSGDDRNLRYDSASFNTSVMPETERFNGFLTGNWELTDAVTAFGEVGYYNATTTSVQGPTTTLTSLPLTIPASNYWNPFGPTVFANGQANPNRLAGINAPAAGLGVTLRSYAFVDVGPNIVDVELTQTRFLGGLRGDLGGFKWESGLLYSHAKAEDTSDGISATLLQRQLALSTPDAYNPFSGGDPANPSIGDASPSSQAAIDAIRIKTERISTSSLTLADLKVSKADLFALPAGDLGFAAGVEWRRETQQDDRDPRLDGTITFTDSVTGITYGNDLIGSSPSPDTKGKRKVFSAYAELAIPVVSPEMDVPFVHNLEFQLAGRYEDFSDVGDVAKPKVAGAWDIFDGFRLRGSWAQGFKAPNLEQINATLVTYLALFPAVFALAIARLGRRSRGAALSLAPAVWVTTELVRAHLLSGFPWVLLGYSQTSVLPIAQLASLFGVYGVSALVVSGSAALAYVILNPSRAAILAGSVRRHRCRRRCRLGWPPSEYERPNERGLGDSDRDRPGKRPPGAQMGPFARGSDSGHVPDDDAGRRAAGCTARHLARVLDTVLFCAHC